MPKVSIIMGVYNCKNIELLHKSIESIINQTYTDWELLICNDGSTDKTLEVLEKIKEIDKRIKILSYDNNQGLSYALNVCLQEATGEYIARQDDDDISKCDRLYKQVEFLEHNPNYTLVGTMADVVDDSGIWGEYNVQEMPQRETFFWTNPFIHPTIMIRSSALYAVGGYRVAKETRRCEDYDLFMRLYSENYKGYNLQEKLYCYRIVNNPNIKYRPMKYRIDEAIVRFKGYKKMGMLFKGFPYVFKPIIIGLIPQKIFYRVRKKQY